MTTRTQATIEDLYGLPDNGKAEIVNGEIVEMAPTGYLPVMRAAKYLPACASMLEKRNQG